MDEVLSVWAIRMPKASDISSALAHGSEFATPVYALLIHVLTLIAGSSKLVMRFPSIIGILLAGSAVFILLRRHLGLIPAILGLSLALNGVLISFALQVRPYALTVCCFAIAMLFWDDLSRKPGYLWRLAAICLLLSFGIALHFYSALYLSSFGIAEILFFTATRRFRMGVWVSLLLAMASAALWLSWIHALSHYNSGDVHSPNYYAQPKLITLLKCLEYFYAGGKFEFLLGLSLSFIMLLLLLRAPRKDVASSVRPLIQPSVRPLYAIALGSLILPFLTFAFARIITGTFNDRYVLPTALGVAILIASFFELVPYSQLISPVLAVVVGLTSAVTIAKDRGNPKGEQIDTVPLFAKAIEPYPIVLSEGIQFFEQEENPHLSQDLKSRIVYLTMPFGHKFNDPTNEHQIERWKTINSKLPVYTSESFLAKHGCFYLMDTGGPSDDLTDYLVEKGMSLLPKAHTGDSWLFLSCAHSAP